MALTDKLSAIGDAIREKTGKTELLTLDAMPLEIASITTGGGGIEVEPIVLTSDCSYACSGPIPSQYINLYGDTITTNGITTSRAMFQKYKNENIPFDINFSENSSYKNMTDMFDSCTNLKEIPKMNNVYPGDMSHLFSRCYMLRELPEDLGTGWDMSRVNSYQYNSCSYIFQYCYSLRKIPKSFLQLFEGQSATSSSYVIYQTPVGGCCSLDELNDMPVTTAAYSSDVMKQLVYYCGRLKDFTFATNEDGTPKTAKWSKQMLDLTYDCGYFYNGAYNLVLKYNSGITADKEVKDDATYQALKNDPDWYTCNIDYSRYNKISAVNTINTLPDTSAYLATAGGTNTIKFKGAAGAKTDGGAINTLTAEEIAVATAKGWTVSFS